MHGRLVRRALALVAAVPLVLVAALPAFAAGGDLDTSWGGTGYVTTSFGPSYSFADGVTTKDGWVVAVGGHDDGAQGDFAIARYLKDGSLDPSFGTGGKVTTDFFGGNDLATAAAFQGEKLVVVGFAEDGSNTVVAVARYLKNGSLDQTFGTGGLVTTDFPGTSYDAANALYVDGDKVLAAGPTGDGGGNNDFGLVRYLKNGSLDTTFGTGGLVTTNLGGNDSIGGVIRSGDKTVAVGYSNAADDYDFAVAEYRKNGTLESGFGTGGVVLTDFGSGNDIGNSVDLDGNRIVAGGWASNGDDDDFAAARYDKNGNLDSSFNGTGTATLDMGDDDDAYGVGVGPGGQVVLAGGRWGAGDFAVARFTKSGAPDPSFGGGDGWVTTMIGGFSLGWGGMAFGSGDRIVVAGFSDDDFAVARYLYR